MESNSPTYALNRRKGRSESFIQYNKHRYNTVTPIVEKSPEENRAGFPLVAFSTVFLDRKTVCPAHSGPARRGRPRRQAGEVPFQ